MAEIRRLDGSKITVEKIGRNDRVADLLARLAQKNDEGRIIGVAFVTLTPEGAYDTSWTWPTDRDGGFPWGLVLEGALARLLHEMRDATTFVDAPETSA